MPTSQAEHSGSGLLQPPPGLSPPKACPAPDPNPNSPHPATNSFSTQPQASHTPRTFGQTPIQSWNGAPPPIISPIHPGQGHPMYHSLAPWIPSAPPHHGQENTNYQTHHRQQQHRAKRQITRQAQGQAAFQGNRSSQYHHHHHQHPRGPHQGQHVPPQANAGGRGGGPPPAATRPLQPNQQPNVAPQEKQPPVWI